MKRLLFLFVFVLGSSAAFADTMGDSTDSGDVTIGSSGSIGLPPPPPCVGSNSLQWTGSAWRCISVKPTPTIAYGGVSGCRGYSVATCPAGKRIVGGGHRFYGSCGCSEKYRFAVHSFPTATQWILFMECSRSRAYALCI